MKVHRPSLFTVYGPIQSIQCSIYFKHSHVSCTIFEHADMLKHVITELCGVKQFDLMRLPVRLDLIKCSMLESYDICLQFI